MFTEFKKIHSLESLSICLSIYLVFCLLALNIYLSIYLFICLKSKEANNKQNLWWLS